MLLYKSKLQAAHEEAVDLQGARRNPAGDAHGPRFVAAEQGSSQAIVFAISQGDHLVVVLEGLLGQYGTKHFLLGDLGGGIHIRKQRRRKIEGAEIGPRTAPQRLGAGGLDPIDEARHPVEVFLGDQRAAAWPISLAAPGDPVQLIRSIPRCLTKASPACSPIPCATVSSPAGSPNQAATGVNVLLVEIAGHAAKRAGHGRVAENAVRSPSRYCLPVGAITAFSLVRLDLGGPDHWR